jgi:uncharacterized phage-associated protein
MPCCLGNAASLVPVRLQEFGPTMSTEANPQMFVSREREKLINTIVFFLKNTNHCHTLKLFKLLNLADFEHFRQKGRTITGLQYRALPKGPVPTALLDEFQRGGDKDLKTAVQLFAVKDEITDALLRRDLKPRVEFEKNWFTKRELRIMELVAEFFRDMRAEDMSEFSHGSKKPWASVYAEGKGTGKLIPPEGSLHADPLEHDAPTIDQEELNFRRELLRDIS